MNISVIASTKPNYVATKEEIEIFSGHNAGVCYMPSTFEELINEKETKTIKRVAQTKGSGHHSVYDHATISLYLENIPKALALVLNNEKQYTTSEKSARYTKMKLTEKEQVLFDKWLERFKVLIKDKYQEKFPKFFTDSRIEKLAQETARYLISVFTPTSMVYSTTYRQLNNIYHMMQKEIERPDEEQNKFYIMLKPYFKEFCKIIKEQTPYFDELIHGNAKSRTLSLMHNNEPCEEHFGTVYSTNYKTSFACLAQAMRHRTLSYTMSLLDKPEYYIPALIRNDKELKAEWIHDMESRKDYFPQGMLVSVNEMGTFDNFVLKMMERKCSFAQLEINEQVNDTLKKYAKALCENNHPRAEEMAEYTNGSRCTFKNFTCTAPCYFSDGITERRKI